MVNVIIYEFKILQMNFIYPPQENIHIFVGNDICLRHSVRLILYFNCLIIPSSPYTKMFLADSDQTPILSILLASGKKTSEVLILTLDVLSISELSSLGPH